MQRLATMLLNWKCAGSSAVVAIGVLFWLEPWGDTWKGDNEPEHARGTSIAYEDLETDEYNNESWFEPGLKQEYLPIGFEDVRIVEKTLDYGTGVWNSLEIVESSAFPIGAVRSSGKDFWYLTGVDAAGNTVFEQWRLKSGKTGLLGQSPKKSIKRTEIFRGLCETIIDFAVDPERRFLLALGRDTSGVQYLYQLALAPGSLPVLILSGIQVQDLNASDFIQRYDHLNLGRMWVIMNEDPGQSPAGVIVLLDSNNDGVFDPSPLIGDGIDLYSNGVIDPSLYVDTFMGDD